MGQIFPGEPLHLRLVAGLAIPPDFGEPGLAPAFLASDVEAFNRKLNYSWLRQPLFVGRAASCRGKMAGRTLWGRGALIHSRYGIGRKKSRRPANTRQNGAGKPQAWYAHYSSPKCRHRQVVIEHRSAAKHGAPKLPAAVRQRCSQSLRRAVAVRLPEGGWRSPEGVRARTVRSVRRPGQNIPAACAFGRRCISTTQPQTFLQFRQQASKSSDASHLNVSSSREHGL